MGGVYRPVSREDRDLGRLPLAEAPAKLGEGIGG